MLVWREKDLPFATQYKDDSFCDFKLTRIYGTIQNEFRAELFNYSLNLYYGVIHNFEYDTTKQNKILIQFSKFKLFFPLFNTV